MRKILLFGGSFDPPHKGHVLGALAAMHEIGADKLIFIPNKKSPLKDKIYIDPMHKVNMLLDIIQQFEEHERIHVTSYELKQEYNYTIDTIKHFKEMYPEDDLYLLIGSDCVDQLPSWKNYLEILETVKVCCMSREGHEPKEKFNIRFLNTFLDDISSTKIREKISEQNEDFLSLVMFSSTLRYIKENNLYDINKEDM